MIIYIILHREIPHRLPDYFAIYSIVGYSADYIRITHKPAIQNLYNSYCLCALHVAPLSAYRVYGLPSPFGIAALLLCVALGVERWRRVSTEGFRSRAKVWQRKLHSAALAGIPLLVCVTTHTFTPSSFSYRRPLCPETLGWLRREQAANGIYATFAQLISLLPAY